MLQQKSDPSTVQSAQSRPSELKGAGVEGELSFIIADGRKPFSHQYDPPPGQPVRSHQYESRRVLIQDGRAVADTFSIDREGFALVPHATKTADLYDEAALKHSYYPETE